MTEAENATETPPAADATVPLGKRVRDGGIVMFGGFGFSQLLRLISNLALARLLAPEAFGLMAVAISINVWAMMLTDIGINVSVIRSRNSDKEEFIQTAWTMQILRNAAIWLLICLAALGIYFSSRNGIAPQDSIFSNPLLPIVMVALGVELLINGFTSMNMALAERKLAMTRIVALEVGARFASMVVAIGCAFFGLGVFSLVIGSIAGVMVTTLLSFPLFDGPRMGIRLDRSHFGEIFHFGKWLILASLFGFVLNRGDQIIFAWVMEANRFSLYAIASIWIVAASTAFQTVFPRVLMPAFSEIIRERPEKLKASYQKVRLISDGIVFSIAFSAFFLAEPVFDFIYPDEFRGVGYFVKLLLPMLLFLPYRLISVAALAGGDSKRFTAVTVVGALAMMIIVPYAFAAFGEKLGVISYACIAVFTLPLVWRLGQRFKIINWWAEMRMIAALILFLIMLAPMSA